MENNELSLIPVAEIEKPKFHLEAAETYTKTVPVYDKEGNQIGTKEEITGRIVKKVWDDPEELAKQQDYKELVDLEKWFTEVYDAQVKQYDRCQRLGVEYDNKYGTIAELDKQATANAKRISELRNKYSTK